MRPTLAAAVLGLAVAVPARTFAADPPQAPQGRDPQTIAKVKDFAKREADRLARKAGRAEKVVREQAPKAVDQVVDWAGRATGAQPAKK
jgi:hypothetical protein